MIQQVLFSVDVHQKIGQAPALGLELTGAELTLLPGQIDDSGVKSSSTVRTRITSRSGRLLANSGNIYYWLHQFLKGGGASLFPDEIPEPVIKAGEIDL